MFEWIFEFEIIYNHNVRHIKKQQELGVESGEALSSLVCNRSLFGFIRMVRWMDWVRWINYNRAILIPLNDFQLSHTESIQLQPTIQSIVEHSSSALRATPFCRAAAAAAAKCDFHFRSSKCTSISISKQARCEIIFMHLSVVWAFDSLDSSLRWIVKQHSTRHWNATLTCENIVSCLSAKIQSDPFEWSASKQNIISLLLPLSSEKRYLESNERSRTMSSCL